MNLQTDLLSVMHIDPTVFVIYRGEKVLLRTVPLGRQFTHNGRVYQASIGAVVRFDKASIGTRFRFRSNWCMKQGTGAYQLAENMPFGPATKQHEYVLPDAKVDVLEITDRGPA